MTEFWDNIFKTEELIWGQEPSDSAIFAKDLFVRNNIRDILIPGIGYGRNAKIFLDNGITVSGIEISKSAINSARKNLNLNIKIHHGSVLEMPFDNSLYDGIFSYALIHLFNRDERKEILKNCFTQLQTGGYMVFTVVSKKDKLYGQGKLVSENRYEISEGVRVYFYDNESVQREFEKYGLFDFQEIDEPIKFKENEPPLKCILIKCKKG
jgi:SAM-dependent methyltransferase